MPEDLEPARTVTVEIRDHVAIITIDRPHTRNALRWSDATAIGDILRGLSQDQQCRAVVLTGAGAAFCSGGDVKGHAVRRYAPGRGRDVLAELGDIVNAIWEFPKPLLAAVNGSAVGAGAGLALLCDTRVIDPSATISFPFGRVGLTPDFGVSWTLPRLVGTGWAARLLFSGETVGASRCVEIGLAEELSLAGDSVAHAVALAEVMGSTSPAAAQATKALLRGTPHSGFNGSLDDELDAQLSARLSPDHAEGVAAFLEKRRPAFEPARTYERNEEAL